MVFCACEKRNIIRLHMMCMIIYSMLITIQRRGFCPVGDRQFEPGF